MFCPSCGSEMKDGTKFCPFCGAEQPLSSQSSTPSQQAIESDGQAAPASPTPQAPAEASAPAAQPAVPDSVPVASDAAAPAPLPTSQKPKPRGPVIAAVAVAAVLAVALIAVLVVGVFPLGGGASAGSGSGAAAQTSAKPAKAKVPVAVFGQGAAVNVSQATKIFLRDSADKALTHYFVRIREAKSADGKDIEVFSYPLLEVKSNKGFTLADFAADLPAGTYQLVATGDSDAVQPLPPLTVPAAGAVADAGDSAADKGGTDSSDASAAKAPAKLDIVPADSDRAPKDTEAAASTTVKQGKYAAFLKVIQDEKAKYGEPQKGNSEYYGPMLKGLCFARLINFGDGDERLVIARSSTDDEDKSGVARANGYVNEVWRYDAQTDTANRELLVACSGSEGLSLVGLSTGRDGHRYLQSSLDSDVSADYEIFGLDQGGAMRSLEKLSSSFVVEDLPYAINGSEVSKGQFAAEFQKYGIDYNRSESQYSFPIGDETWVLLSDMKGGSGVHSIDETAVTVADLVNKLTLATTTTGDVETKTVG